MRQTTAGYWKANPRTEIFGINRVFDIMLYFQRILSMYTTWNWIGITVYATGITEIVPYLRWNSLLILIGSLVSILITEGYPFADVLKRVTGMEIPGSVAWILDAAIHLGPVLLLGLPTTGNGFVAAMLGLGAWYIPVRPHIQTVYTPTVRMEQYDRIIQIVLVIGLCIYGAMWKVQDTGK